MPRLEFLPCLKVVSRKSAERILKRKASLSKGVLKRTTARIFVSRLLELSLKKKKNRCRSLFISYRKCCVIFTSDEDRIPINTHESRFSKSTERIKSKNISLERLFKAQDSSILVSRLLELSVRKSQCKCLHI